MLGFYKRQARRLDWEERDPALPIDADTVWIDAWTPSQEEIRRVERWLGVELPTREEMQEIEASSRVYEEGGAIVLTATVLINADSPPPDTVEITFIIKGEMLVTLRYADPQPFRTMSGRLDRIGPTLNSGLAAFFWIQEQTVARVADVLERGSNDLENMSSEIFAAARKSEKKEERIDLVEALARIGRNGDTTAKVRECLHALQRILLAVSATDVIPPSMRKDARARAKVINRDVASLIEHTGFVTGNVNLLLDATLGLINIEQTNIIKIFSVLAIVFLPPTLIASIYGMNFQEMPELSWHLGYPLAIILMIASAICPYLFFKRKGWL
ncbi:magnesium transporter [Arboricoccus pini]|uniref:Magnesium transport protein CorA n=1 Tax=Arboricoccus pini TaxID=1963835 RepID=A0A212QQ76_9PROT|nr:magnesium transporter CorA family protein [Arboricoccus pini]SNB61648.1 magnesium transporter [Arboricoccus pini]